ncbi:MAG: hypothetical protein M3O31_05510 [Acidobacteriota bacterium]|nr:hypothetical protein [Acidobacteriota bacterium]
MHWKPASWILISVLLAACTASASAQIATTQVTDTIYHADGTPATGTVLISWPAFTTASGESIPSGNTSAAIPANGGLSIALTTNAGASPIGTYYTAVYHLDDGTVSRQYWVVPASLAPVRISAIESIVLPTSVAMQIASKSYVDTAIAASTGGLGQKVLILPSTTQTVVQPTGTQLDVNNLNGTLYASQYGSGSGNNGIANAAASSDCSGGCEIVAEPGYTTEQFSAAALNDQTHVHDTRGGRQVDSYKNPLDQVGHGPSAAQVIDAVSTQSEASIFQQTGSEVPGAMGVVISQEGLAGGSNLFPENIDSRVPYFKMGFSALTVNGTYNTQGQHVLVSQDIHCYGVGDCLMGSRSLLASGGMRDSADEGAHPFDLQSHEDSRVFLGTCATQCTLGSTSVMVAPTAAAGTQGDGRFLINTAPAKRITSESTGGTLIGGNSTGPHASAQFAGTHFPVSVFLSLGQAVPSQASDIAPGTVTFSIAGSGVPPGYATNTAAIGSANGLACVVDQTSGSEPNNYEMAPYTVVDATHLRMTLNKPHQQLASLAFGGLCGYGLEQTVDTAGGIRQLFPVLGATSATSLYYAGAATPIVGIMGQTSAFLNVNASIASLTRLAGLVTVITNSNLAANINGLNVTIAGAADSSYNGDYLVTTTGTNSFSYVQSGANSSTNGGTASILTGGFALYPMAEVLSVFDEATKSIDGQFTLAPNSVAWAANDTVEEPHFYQESVTADTEFLGQSVPRPSVITRAGLQYQQNNGPGLIGWSIQNAAPTANYLGYGGTHTVPDGAYEATGVWRRTMNLAAGEQAAFAIHCNLHGCGSWNSGYNLFELDSSAGADTISYAPPSSSLSLNLRGTAYSFTPQAFNAGTINVGTLNATTINGVAIGGSHTTTVTLQHTFAGAGTFNYAHSLSTLYPLMTCYVNSGSPAYTAANIDINHIAITVTAASDITCTFGN